MTKLPDRNAVKINAKKRNSEISNTIGHFDMLTTDEKRTHKTTKKIKQKQLNRITHCFSQDWINATKVTLQVKHRIPRFESKE